MKSYINTSLWKEHMVEKSGNSNIMKPNVMKYIYVLFQFISEFVPLIRTIQRQYRLLPRVSRTGRLKQSPVY